MAGRRRTVAARVVDASAVAAVLFGEPDAERIAQELEGQDLCAPSLLPYELASVARKKAAAVPAMAERIVGALGLYSRMGVRLVDVDPVDAVRVADEFALTTYDAAYLSLARDFDLPLVTLAARLRRASKMGRVQM